LYLRRAAPPIADKPKFPCGAKTMTTMQQTISFITLGVADLARSRAFYAALGWRESSASQETIAFYAAGTVVFALFERQALADDAGVPATGSGFRGFTLAHNVASADAVVATSDAALAVGGSLASAPASAPWGGFRGYFADPDGFLWEVCWNPFFPLDAHGVVTLPT
jgi:catechol 2,3-dioxygenase-like lactoylglutathione lyase family enzyme